MNWRTPLYGFLSLIFSGIFFILAVGVLAYANSGHAFFNISPTHRVTALILAFSVDVIIFWRFMVNFLKNHPFN